MGVQRYIFTDHTINLDLKGFNLKKEKYFKRVKKTRFIISSSYYLIKGKYI